MHHENIYFRGGYQLNIGDGDDITLLDPSGNLLYVDRSQDEFMPALINPINGVEWLLYTDTRIKLPVDIGEYKFIVIRDTIFIKDDEHTVSVCELIPAENPQIYSDK